MALDGPFGQRKMEEEINILDEQISLLTHRTGETRKWCVSLHGGGPSSKESSEYLSSIFLKVGISFSSFDFSGQGKSSGQLERSSLKRRGDESIKVLEHLNCKPTVLIGTSMGGYVAVKLTEMTTIQNLILFCPAAYSKSSWSLEFGNGFTEEIRRKNSFLETDIAEISREFRGSVLLVYGSNDDVIPSEIQNLYETVFTNAKMFRKIVIKDCPHPIHRWIQNQPESKRRLLNEIEKFLRICI